MPPRCRIHAWAYDRYQLARGYALLRERRPAVEQLAAEAAEYAGPRPPWHYYRTPAHLRIEAGLVEVELGRRARAVELLREGLDGLPAEMRGADWTGTYRAALASVPVRTLTCGHRTPGDHALRG